MEIDLHDLNSGSISDPTSYEGMRWNLLLTVETVTHNAPDLGAYDDQTPSHIPTIGVGFNLRILNNLIDVMAAFLGNPNFDTSGSLTKPQDKVLVTKLQTIMGESWASNLQTKGAQKGKDGDVPARLVEVVGAINAYYVSITPPGGTAQTTNSFSLTSSKAETAFATIAARYEQNLTNALPHIPGPNGQSVTIGDSDEHLALLSLYWNASTLVGSNLTGALRRGDRASAWFEIRYNSNAGSPSDQKGAAKRRYFESSLFGLYNEDAGAAIPVSEALNTYAVFSDNQGKNRATAFQYETLWSSQITAANSDFASVGITSQSLEATLQPAATALNALLNDKSANPYYGSTANFDPLDIQVAVLGGGNKLVATTRDLYQLGTGAYTSALLMAQGGSDTLDDTAAGVGSHNALIGGTGSDTLQVGDDTFNVGDGDDYIVAGSGNALIEGRATGSAIGKGHDTIVLGEANAPWNGGDDTVWGGAGNEVYYLGVKSQFTHIHLGSGHSTVNFVDSPSDISALAFDATNLLSAPLSSVPLAESLYEDRTNHKLVRSTLNPDGTKDLEIFELPPLLANSPNQSHLMQDFSLASMTESEETDTAASDDSGELIIDGYTGSNLSGIQLTENSGETIQSSNLSELRQDSSPQNEVIYYDDLLGHTVSAIYGSSTPSSSLSLINGEGNANYIYAGNGDVDVWLGDLQYTATNPLDISLSAMIQGGSGNQLLVGVGNGEETINGGAAGSDTSALTQIDGGGADALLEGGGQNSIILGGTGTDTLIASSADASEGQTGFNPYSLAVAGLSFWGNPWYQNTTGGTSGIPISNEPMFSIPGASDPGNFQVDISLYQSDNTYGSAFGLLGSSLDPGVAPDNATIPGSMLVGGSGEDWLLGNTGDDTLVGGSPLNPVNGVVDEILAGGAGSDLIYGGDGSEAIFADLSPGAANNWADLDPDQSDTIYGGSGNEYIYGAGGDEDIYGGSGNYTIYVGNGDSQVETGSGNTIVYGGTGNDSIVAGAGTDSIETGGGNTYVYAGDGNSTVTVGAGDDTLEAGTGSTNYNAGSGTDTYVIGSSGGTQQIIGASGSSGIRLTFASDVSSDDIVARRDTNGNLVLTNQGTGREVILQGYFQENESNVQINWADGTIWQAADIVAATMLPSDGDDVLWGYNGNDSITGGIGSDTIIGVFGNNVLTGGSGNSTIEGGSGADSIEGGSGANLIEGGSGAETYLFQIGDGSSTITESTSGAGSDTLVFGDGIDPADVSFSRVGSTNNLLIELGGLSDSTIVVSGFFGTQSGSQHQIGSFTFSDGTSLSNSDVATLASGIYTSDGGNDSIHGGSGNSHIFGGSGSDTLVGGSGNNTITGGSGTELIEGGTGWNTLIGGSGDDTLIAGSNGDLIEAGTGRALIETGAGDDTVSATGGQDTLIASNGDDSYLFGIGSGQETLAGASYYFWTYDSSKSGTDALWIASGLTASDLTFSRIDDDDSLVVGVKGTTDSFTIEGYFSNPGSYPLNLQFQDGGSLSFEDINALANDHSGWSTNSFDTNGGQSTPAPYWDGNVLNLGDGALALDPNWAVTPDDVANGWIWPFPLGQGIRPQDVLLQAQGDSVLLSIRGTADSLYIPGLLNPSVEGYELTGLSFYDGTAWDFQTLMQHVTYGSGSLNARGEHLVVSDSGVDIFPSGPNDTIDAGDGEAIHFGFGDGQTIVNVSDNDGNLVVFGPGVNPDDVTFQQTEYGDKFTLKSTGETLTIIGNGVGNSGGGEAVGGTNSEGPTDHVQFADGSVWDRANLFAMGDIGVPIEAGYDHAPATWTTSFPQGTHVLLTGTQGSTLDVGPGSSVVVIGDGYQELDDGADATIVYSEGDGDSTISPSDLNNNGHQVLQFGAGIQASDLHVTRSFDYNQTIGYDYYEDGEFSSDGSGKGNLLIGVGTTGGTIDIPYAIGIWNGSPSLESPITTIEFQDGSTLDLASLINAAPMGSGVVVGQRGSDTLSGASGDTIDAAFGNTVVLGQGQTVNADDSALANPAVAPANTTYVFNTATSQDTITANMNSTLEFGPGISASDVEIFRGVIGSSKLVYIKSTGAYVELNYNDNPPWTNPSLNYMPGEITTFQFSDGSTYSSEHLLEEEFTANSTIVTTDGSGASGYYAAGNVLGYSDIAVVRGAVSNSVLGGDAWSGFDASAADVSYLAPSMQQSISQESLSQPVTFDFVADGSYDEIVNYDANDFTVKLAAGVGPDDVSLAEYSGEILLYVNGPGGVTSTLEIDGFYGSVAGESQEKPFQIQFSDGTTWNDEDIKQALWSGQDTVSGGDQGDIWIASVEQNPIDLTKPGEGLDYHQYVAVKTDGSNTIILGNDDVDASQGINTFVISRTSSAIIENFDPASNIVQFASDIDPSDLVVSQAYSYVSGSGPRQYEYMFTLRSTGQQVLTLRSSLFNAANKYDPLVQFSNGITWSAANLSGVTAWSGSGLGYTGYVDEPGTDNGIVVDQAIRGTVGDEVLSGGIGDDDIAAGTGDDTLIGGGGHDTLYGGSGFDTFVFGHGSGHDTIVASNDGVHMSKIAFSADVDPDDVSVVRPNGSQDLQLVLNDTGEAILLPNYFEDTQHQGVDSVVFSDGTVWSASDLARLALPAPGYVLAGAGHESIVATPGNCTLVGDGSIDTLTGGSGNDVIQGGSSGLDTIYGGSGHDTVYENDSLDWFVAGSGSATVYGGTGLETYQFGSSFGQATLLPQADPGTNLISFIDGIVASDVSFSIVNGQLQISLDSGQGSIVLPNHYVDGQTQVDVGAIAFADGVVASMSQIDALLSESGGSPVHFAPGDESGETVSDNGNDTLSSSTQAPVTLVGGSGSDHLVAGVAHTEMLGGTGAETYVVGGSSLAGFSNGDLTGPGWSHIVTNSSENGANAIDFTGVIAPSGLIFQRVQGTSLEIIAADGDGYAGVLVNGYFDSNGDPTGNIQSITFADGSSLDLSTINAAIASADGQPVSLPLPGMVATGASPWLMPLQYPDEPGSVFMPSQTTITGGVGNEEFDLSGGHDYLSLSGGNDTIYVSDGDNEISLGSGDDTVNLQSDGNTVVLGAGDSQVAAANYEAKLMVGNGSGNDSVSGFSTSEIIYASGVMATDIAMERQGDDLVLTNQQSGGSIDIQDWYVQDSSGTSRIEFSDGSYWVLDASNPGAQPAENLVASAGNEYLVGAFGDDTLRSDGGNDTLVGGAGSTMMYGAGGADLMEAGSGASTMIGGNGAETYQFGDDFGPSIIKTIADAPSLNTIVFNGGILASQLSYTQNGSDLLITVANGEGGGSTITLAGHFVDGAPVTEVGEIVFADGSSMSMSEINQQFSAQPQGSNTAGSPGQELSKGGADGSSAGTSAGAGALTIDGNGGRSIGVTPQVSRGTFTLGGNGRNALSQSPASADSRNLSDTGHQAATVAQRSVLVETRMAAVDLWEGDSLKRPGAPFDRFANDPDASGGQELA